MESWEEGIDCCSWAGVTCDRMGRDVIGLDLSDSGLQGTIPSNSSLFHLSHLQWLNLSFNNFSPSPISSGFGQFGKLKYLNLSRSQFSGQVPLELSYLSKLTSLDLSGNTEVSIGKSVMDRLVQNLTKLRELHLDKGDYQDNIFRLPNLRVLTLNRGKLPPSLSSLKALSYMDFQSNNLSGTIPVSFGGLTKVMYFCLSSNNFTGQIPSSLSKLEDLTYLDLANNNFVEIPSSICNLSSLQVLDLSRNNLSGMIPQCLGNLSDSLSVVDFRKNNFHGTIPKKFAKCNSLRTLVFNGNQLEGLLPQSLVNCTKLEVLDLGNNKLNDSFPYWLEALPKLQVLVLRSNRFSGRIGGFKTNSSFPMLCIIDLSHNEFIGVLPTKFFEDLKAIKTAKESEVKPKYMGEENYQDSIVVAWKGNDLKLERILTIFTTMDLSSNKFYGQIPQDCVEFPLSKKCKTDEPPPPPSIVKEDNDSIFTSGFGWKAVLMGYGFGFMFGSTMGYLMLKIGKPELLIRLIEGEWHGKHGLGQGET
uniref:Uncharacterized protein n=1 Tax=Fagus sylvatica TaxID=28930 RepID=A0A2N9EGA2_FAGSY